MYNLYIYIIFNIYIQHSRRCEYIYIYIIYIYSILNIYNIYNIYIQHSRRCESPRTGQTVRGIGAQDDQLPSYWIRYIYIQCVCIYIIYNIIHIYICNIIYLYIYNMHIYMTIYINTRVCVKKLPV